MPNINDRIGSQNVIRVLSNASAPPTRIVNLTDVDSTIRDDGVILVWNSTTEQFITTSVIDSATFDISSLISFTNTTDSSLITNGALVISGGVGVGKNLNIGGNVSITGLSTFASDLDINAAVDIFSNLDVGGNVVITGLSTFASDLDINAAVDISSALDVTGKITANGLFESKGATTLAANGGITTTGGDLYVDDDLYVGRNVNVVGSAILGSLNIQQLNVSGITTLGVTTLTNITGQQLNISGITTLGVTTLTDVTAQQLNVSGVSTFSNNVNVTGFVTVTEGLYYDSDDYTGPNGIAYFDNTGKLIGAAATTNALTTSNFILTTDAVGIPTWTSIIDGGEF